MKTIIIGGVAAGMSAASKLRRLDEKAVIHVYEKGTDLSYAGCGMPYYLGDVITEERKLIARFKEDFEKNDINVFLNHEVVKVDSFRKTIEILDKTNNKIKTDNYDKLVIATGTKAYRTNVPGSELVEVFVLNSLQDMRDLKEKLEDVNSVAIIGGGYIGLEVADNLILKGKKVHIIERLPQILNTFDREVAEKAAAELVRLGVEIHVGESVKEYERQAAETIVHTDKNKYKVDLVIEAIGVKPNTDFLKDSRINMAKNGAIIVNDYMETSIRDIYAAGDCVLYKHLLKHENVFVPLGTHANKSGRVVAENIAGNRMKFPGIIGSNILKVGELTFAKTGLGIDEAEALKLGYEFVDVQARNQAGYYPGAKKIFIRIVYDPRTKVLKGAQLVGEKGVSDRINIMALAITKELTAHEFSQMDFAYSPPYATVWDALQIATNQIK